MLTRLPRSTLFPYTTLFRSVSGRLVSLPAPVLRRDNRWLVPVDFMPRALSPAIATRIDYWRGVRRSEEHTSELQSLAYLVCRLLLEKKKTQPQPLDFMFQAS